MWVNGIDVSNWQGIIDWSTVNANPDIRFVYALVSDGFFRGKVDGAPLSIGQAYARNKQQCSKPIGAYHYARPSSTDPERVAEDAFNNAGAGLSLPFMLDIEEYSDLAPYSVGFVADWSRRWLLHMEALDGRKPIIYCSAFFKRTGIHFLLPNYLWWLPSYTANSTLNPDPSSIRPAATNGPKTWDIWQYTSHGRIAGITGNVDRNVIPLETLLSLFGDDMPSIDELTTLLKQTIHAPSFITHADGTKSSWLPKVFGDSVSSNADIILWVFDDGTMRRLSQVQRDRLVYMGVEDLGFRDDSFHDLLTAKPEDKLGFAGNLRVTVDSSD